MNAVRLVTASCLPNFAPMELTLGFSPCPNDTFIFDALVNAKIDTGSLSFRYVMEDVETLNRWADRGKLDITKLSYHSFLHNVHQYALLHSGSALGKGVGPLIVSKPQTATMWQNAAWRKTARVAIPGNNTTANLLLSLAYPELKNKTELVFSEIENAVLSGDFDAGLIIHESRFTYSAKGLIKLADLGDWWEAETGSPIPLGGIGIKRSLPAATAAQVDQLIKQSLDYSRKNYPKLAEFVTCHAQEMEEEVMRQHIDLYVNNYSEDLGESGRAAISTMFARAMAAGLIDKLPGNILY